MQVLHVCSEMFPLLKTGGPSWILSFYRRISITGQRARTATGVPRYPSRDPGCQSGRPPRDFRRAHYAALFGPFWQFGIYLIDAPHLCDRPGSYADTNLNAYHRRSVQRFALLS